MLKAFTKYLHTRRKSSVENCCHMSQSSELSDSLFAFDMMLNLACLAWVVSLLLNCCYLLSRILTSCTSLFCLTWVVSLCKMYKLQSFVTINNKPWVASMHPWYIINSHILKSQCVLSFEILPCLYGHSNQLCSSFHC